MDKKSKSMINNQALSLILTLLIIGSILTGTVLVGDVIIRHSQVVKGTEISELAYFAAEAALEKGIYEVLENYEDISTYEIPSTALDNGALYSIGVGDAADDTACPDVPTGCSAGVISSLNAWSITLSPEESFQLDLNINEGVYMTNLNIGRSGSEPSDLIIFECTTVAGPPRECSSESEQTFKVSFPYDLDTSSYASKYWKIRINNIGSGNETYTLTPSGGSNALPIGIEISATGTYSDYERKIKSNFPKWQIFGGT